MARAAYEGDLQELQRQFDVSLVALQISRATYLDICVQDQAEIDTVTDSLEREDRSNALQDEKMEFFAAVEKGKLVLGDTILHIAIRLSHDAIVDFLLLTDHIPPRPSTTAPTDRPSSSQSARVKSSVSPAKSTGSGRNSTQIPNFRGQLPRDVVPTNTMRLVLDNVSDVHEVFGVEYRDEPKVHRFVRSLRRIWPLWMFEGQPEAANLVRVVYDVRSSDAAFGNLVKVALSVSERFRTNISIDGVRVALRLLADSNGEIHVARQTLTQEWTGDYKRQVLFAIYHNCFREWQSQPARRNAERDTALVEFFESALEAWLQIVQDLRLMSDITTADAKIAALDTTTLRRYDLLIWKRRMRPPPVVLDDLCMHINALESYLLLAHLKA
ncbi:hypothetical protein Poli38472_012862 [Pythium oligandrum]|uniref:Uncharacterized protein n=1 Tax=Pythium oligandrum TaxID=41045 RepID=A0A8K1CJ83_PYTOL|nr:hypothetical protein Poli38472_012862 [Pythium oligandrum]|eukprot:TMW64240.1 hypothetical protein Poli38472_012862 [Pythium oligandrum]